MDDDTIRKEIAIGYEYSYKHEEWITPLDEALAGVSASDALWRLNADSKGIWDIVLHLAVWNENIVERIETGQKAHPAEGPWPAPPSSPDPVAWEAAKKRLCDSISQVQTMLDTTSLEKLQAGPYGIGDLLCRLTHHGYHIGQITKIRECASLVRSVRQPRL